MDEPFLKDLDISSLELVNAGFVSKEFARRESDLIWKLSVAGTPVFLYLLIEFQSAVDRTMPLRFLRYLTEFYESQVDQLGRTGSLPAVFPLLLYNGDERWTASRSVQEMIHPTIPARYIPHLSYYPILINRIPARKLRRIHNAVSAVFYVENASPEDAPETIDVLIDILREEVPELRDRFTDWFANYLAGQGLDVAAEGPVRDLQEVKAMFATRFQEYSQRLKNEGRSEGREEGRSEGRREGQREGRREGQKEGRRQGRTAERIALARRLLERGETVEAVAELTGLPVGEVEKLASER